MISSPSPWSQVPGWKFLPIPDPTPSPRSTLEVTNNPQNRQNYLNYIVQLNLIKLMHNFCDISLLMLTAEYIR